MDELFLVEPNISYADQIMNYRQEFLDRGDSMDGCGPLRSIDNPDEYIRTCAEHEIKLI